MPIKRIKKLMLTYLDTNTRMVDILHMCNDGFKASLIMLLPFIAIELGFSMTGVGFLGTTLNLLDIFLAIPSSYLALKWGGRRALIMLLLLYTFGYFFTAFSSHYLLVVLAFLLSAIGFGMFHTIAFAYVARNSEAKKRGDRMGQFTAMGDVGRIGLSSLFTFLIAYYGWRNATLLYADILLGIFLVLYVLGKKDSKFHVKPTPSANQIRFRDLLKNSRFMLASTSYVLDALASNSLYIFIPFLLLKRGVTPALLGLVTSCFFLGNIFGKLVFGKFIDRFGNQNIFIFSEFCMAIFIVAMSVSSYLPLIIGSSLFLGLFTKGTVPILTHMVSESIEKEDCFEKAFALNGMMVGIALAVGPVLLGFISDKAGIEWAFGTSAGIAICATFPILLNRYLIIRK